MSDLQQLLARQKLSIKEFTRQLAPFLEIDWSDSWYQHIYRVVKGEVDPTKDEHEAIIAWIHAIEKPHVVGAIAFKAQRVSPTVTLLQRYLKTGIYNPTQIDRLFKRVFSALG